MKAWVARFVVAVGLLSAPLAHAMADGYPQRPVKLLVPLSSGSAIDIVARLIAEKMGGSLGQSFYIEDQPGAAGMLGMRAVARSAPDGYTILVANDSVLTMVPNLKPDAGYDPQSDFVPVARLVSIPLGLISSTSFPAKTIGDLIALARKNPNAINYGSGGVGSPHHIATELLMQQAGIRLTHVPYRGITAAVSDVISGQVPLAFTAMSAVFPLLAGNRVRLLGVSTPERMEQLPGVPTIAEAGVPGYSFVAWCAMFAPAGTPPEIVNRLNEAALQALYESDVKKRLIELGFVLTGSTPAELRDYLAKEYKRTGDLIRSAHIEPK